MGRCATTGPSDVARTDTPLDAAGVASRPTPSSGEYTSAVRRVPAATV